MKKTIQELNELVEKLKIENSGLKQEMISFKEKTIDKIKDLEFLNIQYDKLKKENEKLKLDSKGGPSQTQSATVNDLKNKLNASLEENFNIQTEFENFKILSEQNILKKENEIDELKNELLSKEKMIQQITKHRDFLLTTLYNTQEGKNEENLNKYSSVKSFNTVGQKIPDGFVNLYSKSFLENINYTTENEDKNLFTQQSKGELYKENNSNVNTNGNHEDDEEKDFLQNKLAIELENILEERKQYIINTMVTENFSFDIMGSSKNDSSKKQELRLIKNIDEILLKIKQKKEKIARQKNVLINKYESKE